MMSAGHWAINIPAASASAVVHTQLNSLEAMFQQIYIQLYLYI